MSWSSGDALVICVEWVVMKTCRFRFGLAYALFYMLEKFVLQRGVQVCFRLLNAENGEKYCVAALFGRVGLVVQASQARG